MMRKALSVFLSMFCVLFVTAQDLTVRSMEALPFDTYASVHKRLDLNQNPCAVVRVSLPVSGATFSGNVIGDVSRDGSDYLVYMPSGSKKIWVKHPNYHELEVVFGDYGIERLESVATYRVTVNVPQSGALQQKMQTLTIKVTPADAIVQIDGDIVEGTAIALSVGTHRYNVASKGYYPQEGAIEVNENIPAKLLIELDRKTAFPTTAADSSSPAATSLNASSSRTAPSTTGTHNGHEWVDLGLSVKWATCNVGATSSEDYGDHFAWGEISPKDNYEWSNLKYRINSRGKKFSKYVANSRFGLIDNKMVLEPEDDAAQANWGGNWRMPTRAEFQELVDKCTWTWTKMNGKNGYKVVSRENGKYIFLPAAGYRDVTKINGADKYGYYWSSSLSESESSLVGKLGFSSFEHYVGSGYRYTGHFVRPVCQ